MSRLGVGRTGHAAATSLHAVLARIRLESRAGERIGAELADDTFTQGQDIRVVAIESGGHSLWVFPSRDMGARQRVELPSGSESATSRGN